MPHIEVRRRRLLAIDLVVCCSQIRHHRCLSLYSSCRTTAEVIYATEIIGASPLAKYQQI